MLDAFPHLATCILLTAQFFCNFNINEFSFASAKTKQNSRNKKKIYITFKMTDNNDDF